VWYAIVLLLLFSSLIAMVCWILTFLRLTLCCCNVRDVVAAAAAVAAVFAAAAIAVVVVVDYSIVSFVVVICFVFAAIAVLF
jgi:hypothetical protein